VVIAELIRLEESKCGTIGVLRLDKQVFAFTLEPPDYENQINKSSIPAQQYICERFNASRFGETFQVTKVPGRTSILFHAGNVVGHTQGCIILGERVGDLGHHKRALLNSGKTFERFMEKLEDHGEFHLTIIEHY
jgi:hypothetical protein